MSQSSYDERRRGRRTHTTYRLPVVGKKGVSAYLQDISTEGMRVRFLDDTDLEDVTQLRIELPAWVGLGAKIDLDGRFVWVRPCGGEGGPEGGFAFSALPAKKVARIEELIECIQRAAEEDGLFTSVRGRYSASPAGTAPAF